MTEVLLSPPHFPSSSSPTTTKTTSTTTNSSPSPSSSSSFSRNAFLRPHLSLLALLLTLFRKSFLPRKTISSVMDIGSPTNVRHVAHVTFDRFNGFLGLPVEFEPEVPRRPPSASASVFGVSTESMQLSYDSRGNSVPTILLLMQRHLYAQGGLQVEGIFRINADNGQAEHVRDQLNMGVVPEGIDVHCLAGLIKAWFRELPTGILDSLSPEQVMQCQTEEECAEIVRHLPHTEASLLDWAINLMTDVVQHEHVNKMNARNIAMVFAPNMTQMADPISALMYAVQVMNFLKTLVLRTLRERKDSVVESNPRFYAEPSDGNGSQRLLESLQEDTHAENEVSQGNIVLEKTGLECSPESVQNNSTEGESVTLTNSCENLVSNEELYCEFPPVGNMGKGKSGQSSKSNGRKESKKTRSILP
ncbi:rho GTPase-activating protein 5-like isoform X2 [Vigna unguiculata]|uniref:rho GTPase-activating protein 5-like isoform X2 n=1 Tax=Vigna unguiculata TaxID=3917 RepID=UPI001016A6CE|nr:rho GTPase-activating protein 5-like isoform X2 [Vigna unguiculata]